MNMKQLRYRMRDLLSSSPTGQAVERRCRPLRLAASSSARRRNPRARDALAVTSRNWSTLGELPLVERLARTRGPPSRGVSRLVNEESGCPVVGVAAWNVSPSTAGRRRRSPAAWGEGTGAVGIGTRADVFGTAGTAVAVVEIPDPDLL